MGTGAVITGIFIAAAMIIAAVIVRMVIRAAKRTVNSAEAKVVKTLFDAATSQNIGFDTAPSGPKKISNMNKIYLPLIEKDFPAFNWTETRQMIEDELKARYTARTAFTVYETAVSRYEKSGSNITIITESSVSADENGGKHYFAVQTSLSYIRYGGNQTETPGEYALNCPNCSAPLKRNTAGELLCEYCGTLVGGEKTWQITAIREA